MASSSSSPPSQAANESRNWLELPREVTAIIMLKVGVVEILESAQKVCTAWRTISKEPAMWRTIDMCDLGDLYSRPVDLEQMAMHAVDRSCGELVDISIKNFGTNELLHYIAERAGKLRRLRLVSCSYISDEGLSEAAKKLPLLEELIIVSSNISEIGLANVGCSCPQLKSLTFKEQGYMSLVTDLKALAIAKTMPGLLHLQFIGNKMTDKGFQAIHSGCPYLKSPDIDHCIELSVEGFGRYEEH